MPPTREKSPNFWETAEAVAAATMEVMITMLRFVVSAAGFEKVRNMTKE